MVLLDVVYLSMNRNKSYGNGTPKLMEDIMREIELLTRYCNMVLIGLLSSRMPLSLFLSCDDCQRVGNIGKRQEMPMNYSLLLKYLMFRDLISWDLFHPLMGILICWLLLIMLLSGRSYSN